MECRSVAHELDALDLAAIWPVSGQLSLAAVHSSRERQGNCKEAEGGRSDGRD